jgi:hypothetical protein
VEYQDIEIPAARAAKIIELHAGRPGAYTSNLRKLGGKWVVEIPKGDAIVGFSSLTGSPILRGAPVTPTKPIGHRR